MAISESVSLKRFGHKKKMTTEDKVFHVFVCIFFVLFAIVTIYPLFRILTCSYILRTDDQLTGNALLQYKLSWENYQMVFKYDAFRQGLIITTLRTLIGTFLGVTVSSLLAFILSRKKFLFNKSLTFFWTITMYLQAGLIPILIIYYKMHLAHSFWVYILPGMVSVFNVMVMRTYMRSIPDSLEEAAQMEGAGYMRIFFSVVTPLCKPVYAAAAIFIAAYHWNSWFDSMVFNKFDLQYTTVNYELMKLFDSYYPKFATIRSAPTSSSVIAAGIIVSAIPLTILYPFFQKHFVAGLTVGGIKE